MLFDSRSAEIPGPGRSVGKYSRQSPWTKSLEGTILFSIYRRKGESVSEYCAKKVFLSPCFPPGASCVCTDSLNREVPGYGEP